MRTVCRILVVGTLTSAGECLPVLAERAGYETTVVADRDAAFTELDRGPLKAPYSVVVIGGRDPAQDLKLADYAALRGCTVVVIVDDAAKRTPFLARGYDALEMPRDAQELMARLDLARLCSDAAASAGYRGRHAVAVRAARRRRRHGVMAPGFEFAGAMV